MIYTRTVSVGGQTVAVEWTPEHTTEAKEAVANTVGEPNEWPAEVTSEQADQIQAEYQTLKPTLSDGGSK